MEQLLKDLCSDSKRKSNASAAKLTILARKHIDKLVEISHKYGKQYKEHSEYQTGKGTLSFEDTTDGTLEFLYTDSWQYGGSCSEYIYVKILDLGGFDYVNFEKELKLKVVREMKYNIAELELSLEKRKEELLKIESL